jgi:Mn2+/Fe2+ NRAMP family transporter
LAVIFAAGKYEGSVDFGQLIPFEGAELAFLIALMGWMPAPVDMSVWNSIWAEAKQKSTKEDFDYKTSLLDFNVGYWTTLLIAVFFLSLGALVMFNSGQKFDPRGAAFAGQLINLYTSALGDWSWWLISIAAIMTMFSTTLTCLDALPRVMGRAVVLINTPLPDIDHKGTPSTLDDDKPGFDEAAFEKRDNKAYWTWMAILISGSMLIIGLLNLKPLISLATVLSFLTTPFYAIMNFRLITGRHTPEFAKPKMGMRILSWAGLIFLSGFSLLYLWNVSQNGF